jgi:DNA uptake protein ComE-like DNA-binding protein
MIRLIRTRPVLIFVALFSLFVSACSSGGENARSTNTANVSNVSTPTANTSSGTTNQSAGNQSASNTSKGKLNVNTASANDLLTTIPGMGNRMVHEFEEYRPYKSIQQFRREIGKNVKPDQIAE